MDKQCEVDEAMGRDKCDEYCGAYDEYCGICGDYIDETGHHGYPVSYTDSDGAICERCWENPKKLFGIIEERTMLSEVQEIFIKYCGKAG